MQILIDNILVVVAITSAIAALAGAIISFSQFRKTKYENHINRVELDHSRKVLEREIERLHEQIYKDGSRLYELNHLLIDSIRARPTSTLGHHLDIGVSGAAFLKSMGINPQDLQIDPNFVFVLTPLNSNQLPVYEIIKNECQKIGLRVRRGDETRIDGPILPHVIKEITSSKFIVANINGRNPNVFYELGIAQALGKSVILVVKSYDDVPFDLKQQQIVIYNDLDQLQDKFRTSLAQFGITTK